MTARRPLFAFALGPVAAFALAGPALADPRQPPTVEYSATMILTTEGQAESSIKVHYSKGKLRTETTHHGASSVTVVDGPKKETVVWMPAARQFDRWPNDGLDPGAPLGGYEIALEKLGDEAVNGVPAVKSKVTGKSPDGKAFEMMVWATAENIQVKMTSTDTIDGKSVAIGMELRDLKVGPVDPKLFVMPAGLRRMPPPPAPPATPPAPKK